MSAALVEFIGLLVAGIQELATGIAAGVASMASALFLTTDSTTHAVTGLSVFGGIMGIFAGVSLAIGITTKVFLWVTSLGKN